MGKLISAILLLSVMSCSTDRALQRNESEASLVFKDNFDRKELGSNWLDTGGGYKIANGELRVQGARNKPLWLKKKLPREAKITFTARSMSPTVDIKAELWGDGRSRATELSYTATSYVIILGGWNNTRSIIARMNEHGADRKVRKTPKAQMGKPYRFMVKRSKHRLVWHLDGAQFLEMNDPEPLEGPGHEFFAFNNWKSEVFFDDIAIYAL
ncbi:MAG: hypothetical protein QNJ97_05545 [Myxococcota bacterium]|nr:hypothetical protein [Myxococcota bacterium]